GSFELLVNDIVHLTSGIYKCSGKNGKASALPHVSCGSEKACRHMQGRRIQTTGKGTSARRYNKVVGSCKSGNTVKQNDNIFFMLNKTFCTLNQHFGHSLMV